MTVSRTIYIAEHATYILDTDGTLLAVCSPGPIGEPMTTSPHGFGSLHQVYPDKALLIGYWLSFLDDVMKALRSVGRPILWPGIKLRLRSRTFDGVATL